MKTQNMYKENCNVKMITFENDNIQAFKNDNVLSFSLEHILCYHLCYHLMLSFIVINSPLFLFPETFYTQKW